MSGRLIESSPGTPQSSCERGNRTDGTPDIRLFARPAAGWPTLSAICVTTVGLAVLTLTPPRIWTAPWDVLLLLDGAWRIFQGEIPHTDFYNPIGILAYAMVALGIHIKGPSLAALVYGNLLFLTVVVSWGALIFFGRLPGFLAFLLTLFVAVLVAAPRPLGWDPTATSYAMLYNRYGWALILILFTQMFIPMQPTSSRSAFFDCISSGLLFGLLFFCKLSFFTVAVAAVPLAALLRPELRRSIGLTVVGFGSVSAIFWLAAGVNPIDYCRDFVVAAQSQSFDYRISWLRHILKLNVTPALLIAGFWFYLIAIPAITRHKEFSSAIRSVLIVGYVVCTALIITLGNTAEHNDVPLFLVAGLIVLEVWRRQQWVPAESARYPGHLAYAVVSSAISAILFGGIFVKDIVSLAKSGSRAADPPAQRFDAQRLRDFFIPEGAALPTVYWRVAEIPARINEGLAILRRNISSRNQVAVLGYADPFSFALGLTPPKGAPLWWDLGISFDRTHYPPSTHVFSGADYVMYPTGLPEDDHGLNTVTVLHELYDVYLSQNFVEIDRSAHWVLLEKRDQARPVTAQTARAEGGQIDGARKMGDGLAEALR